MVFDLNIQFFSLKMNNINVIEPTAIAKQRDIKGYYKLRKAELIHKLGANPDGNQQVLIRGLEIPSNATRSVQISAILGDPILDDNIPVLKPTKNSLPKAYKR